ncbi:MAG: DUF5683 domain-containing protein [Saprospiraceae bacterium]
MHTWTGWKISLLFILFFLSISLNGQDSTSVAPPFIPVPKKAAIYGLSIPGGGQFYNRRWWKVPLALGAYGGMVYVIDFNQNIYRRLSTAYQLSLKNEPHEFSSIQGFDSNTLRNLRDTYDKRTQMSYVGMFLVHTLVAMEAFVDAHLLNFDIDEQLVLKIKPQYYPISVSAGLGISATFTF